jgi:hypothetical protein
VVYAYATTMRRAQGSTLDLVGLKFDRRRPDRGYAYVGTSRARKHTDVFHLGRIRRSDWLPVGVDSRGNEQRSPGPQSFSDSYEDSDPPTDEDEETENGPSQIADDCFDSDVEDYTAWNRFRPRVWEEPGPGQQPTNERKINVVGSGFEMFKFVFSQLIEFHSFTDTLFSYVARKHTPLQPIGEHPL